MEKRDGEEMEIFVLILYNFDETLNLCSIHLQKYFEHFREDRRKTENNSRSGDGGEEM